MILAGHALLAAMAAVPGISQTLPHFDVTDVRPSGPAMNPFTLVSGGVMHGDRYDLRKATMLDLIQAAYHVESETVIGGPNWLEFDRFDIAGKAPAGTPPEPCASCCSRCWRSASILPRTKTSARCLHLRS